MNSQAKKKKKGSMELDSSSRLLTNSVSGMHKVVMSSRHKWSLTSSYTRKGSILAGPRGSKLSVLDDGEEAPEPVKVLDDDGNDVTPQPLYQDNQGERIKQVKTFLDELCFSSFNLPTASPSSSMRASMTKESEDSVPEVPPLPPARLEKRGSDEEEVTEEMLDEMVDIYITETDTIVLLDIPPTYVSEDAEEAEAIKEQNIRYAELCKNRLGNDRYVDRSTQTFSGAAKNKQTQTDEIAKVDVGTIATAWDIYDSSCEKEKTPEKTPEADEAERKDEKSSCCSTVMTGSTTSSQFEKESCRSSLDPDLELQKLAQSELFQNNLMVMERTVMMKKFLPKLAAYRQITLLEDPDSQVEPEPEKEMDERESSSSPTLELLWSFSCELTRGRNITCMVLNKENPDLLAVGYGDCLSFEQKPGLICCWSIKNPIWPERIYHCQSSVLSMDFSAKFSAQLAVGMRDGTMAIYNVRSGDPNTYIASSSGSSERQYHPVWQVRFVKQELSQFEEDDDENVISVSEDGRVSEWFLRKNTLDCRDLKKSMSTDGLPTRSLSIDFHPTNSRIYLISTHGGNIHKCSVYDSQQTLATYKKHDFSVNHIEWSPFCPDVFLSCSSDWSIQLWRQDLSTPVLSFTSTLHPVDLVRWSPLWSTVFAAIKREKLEIWDLNSDLLNPTLVHEAAPGVMFTSLLFARKTNCIFIGDSDGQVSVYQMKNLHVGEGKQVDSLENIIHSVSGLH
ncbi:dynein intermediate chain 4, axonemal [Cheilinus undulatus]|uniref:dynein intermediate chain 4, axonemal n=1 Tax=Cheilinus undulatus TaxID=241271 RepID=UPI001BD45013|nr:dynein intermediate chain 4, axonemal [Cheilinus undulatus]